MAVASSHKDIDYSIRKSLLLRASPSRVWAALTDTELFCAWFGLERATGTFSPGQRLLVVASEEIGGGSFVLVIDVMELERRLVWR